MSTPKPEPVNCPHGYAYGLFCEDCDEHAEAVRTARPWEQDFTHHTPKNHASTNIETKG